MNDADLTSQSTHFDFGKNWASYAEKITQAEIADAINGVSRLVGAEELSGKSFLDIGSGSGLHSLAALRLGASEVVAVDLDPDSVRTTRAVLERHAPSGKWRVQGESVFNLTPAAWGRFDIVYSWGVLHHTGKLHRAVQQASDLVRPGGLFVFALYRRVWMDWFWRREKAWYSRASAPARARARNVYVALFRLRLRLTGRRLADYVAQYPGVRGMDFYHDVHDWMGGWPYESILAHEVKGLMDSLDFQQVREFVCSAPLLGRSPGLFGSGCDEYVYRRRH